MLKRLLLFLLLSCFPFTSAATSITIVCSTDNPEGSLHVVALKKFSELVGHYSNGQIVAIVHYRGSEDYPTILGEEDSMHTLITSHRRLQVTALASGNASLKASILEFLMLPYLFESKDAAQRLFQSDFMNTQINDILTTKHNVRALGWLIGGFRHLTTSNKPIKRIEDIRGMLVRTPRNRLMRDTYRTFGAKVLPMSWSDTFGALQQGVIDGQENPYSVIVDSEFWRAKQKYISNNGPFLWVGPILINEAFFQQLPKHLKTAVTKAGIDASKYQWAWQQQKKLDFQSILINNNMQFIELEDKHKWIKAVKPVWQRHYKYIGYGDIVEGQKIVNQALTAMEL